MRIEPDEKLIEGVMILWSRGLNTAEIAKQWPHCRESEVYHALIIGRERTLKARVA